MSELRKKVENISIPSNDNPHLINYPENAREDVYDGINKKMVDFMFEGTKEYDDSIAIEYFGTKIKYKEMKKHILEYASALKRVGIEKGDFISICLPNIPELVYLKYAANVVGAVSNLIDPRTNPEGIKERVNFSNSKLLFTIQDILKTKIDPVKDKMNVEKIVNISPSHSLPKGMFEQTIETLPVNLLYLIKDKINRIEDTIDGCERYNNIEEFLREGEKYSGTLAVPFEENQPVTALYTSGTTADIMKAGLFSNENYNAMVKNMHYGSKYIKPEKRFLGAIPFFSAYGSFCGFHHSFANAWDVILMPKFKPDEYAKLILKTKSNAALGVPKFWTQLSSIKLKDGDCKNIEIPVTGGDWISQTSVREVNDSLKEGGSSVRLKIGYGATEFGGVVSTTSDELIKYNPNSVGIILPGNDVIIIDPETNKELGYNEAGEACISGPTMMLGYLNNKEATDAITIYKDGKKYYKTGDKMEINEYGDLIYKDRYKRVMMRPDGHTVACSPIEDVIISHPDVENCAVVGVKQNEKSMGVIPTAFVQLKTGSEPTKEMAESIDEYCLKYLGERERALVISFIDKIPYTMNGKINFMVLSSKLLDEIDKYIVDTTFIEKPNTLKRNK